MKEIIENLLRIQELLNDPEADDYFTHNEIDRLLTQTLEKLKANQWKHYFTTNYTRTAPLAGLRKTNPNTGF